MFSASLAVGASLFGSLAAAASSNVSCTSSTIEWPQVSGAEIIGLNASWVANFEGIPGNDICYVTVVLTHPGTGDRVNNYVALPLSGWNGVFQGIGGGGYLAGHKDDMANQTILGYSTAITDAGLNVTDLHNASTWALTSTGNVDQNALLNFAHRSLHDMTVIGKAVSQSFYGCPVKNSYWNGCSTGGRQGLAIAQYYPEDYDGILADAPAIQWNDLTPGQQWPFVVQNNEGYVPTTCELNAVTKTVIKACDYLDGLNDGIISAPGLCEFTGQDLVGRTYSCGPNSTEQVFTQELGNIMDKIWQGAVTPENEFLWYGTIKGANLTNLAPNMANLSAAQPFAIPDSWVRGFLAKDLDFNTSSVSYEEFSGNFDVESVHPVWY